MKKANNQVTQPPQYQLPKGEVGGLAPLRIYPAMTEHQQRILRSIMVSYAKKRWNQ